MIDAGSERQTDSPRRHKDAKIRQALVCVNLRALSVFVVKTHFYFDFFRNHRSKLQGPGPAVKKYKKMKQYSAASSPPFCMGQNPLGMCILK